jgi:hypothetical protein
MDRRLQDPTWGEGGGVDANEGGGEWEEEAARQWAAGDPSAPQEPPMSPQVGGHDFPASHMMRSAW